MGGLQVVQVEVSGVVTAAPSRVWEVVSSFGDTESYIPLLQERQELQLKKNRVVRIGAGRLHEELTLYDADRLTLAYKLVSNDGNVNPFPASFLDHRCHIKLYKVTIKENTFVRIQGSFKTEREMVSIMRDTWEQIYRNMIHGVQTLLDQMGGNPSGRSAGEQGSPDVSRTITAALSQMCPMTPQPQERGVASVGTSRTSSTSSRSGRSLDIPRATTAAVHPPQDKLSNPPLVPSQSGAPSTGMPASRSDGRTRPTYINTDPRCQEFFPGGQAAGRQGQGWSMENWLGRHPSNFGQYTAVRGSDLAMNLPGMHPGERRNPARGAPLPNLLSLQEMREPGIPDASCMSLVASQTASRLSSSSPPRPNSPLLLTGVPELVNLHL
eukprot:jgi/Botrbrau1/17512/Bobra.0734s0002.1